MIPIDQLLTVIAGSSTAAGPLLGLFIYALFRGWVVLGSTHRRSVSEGEQWKSMTLRLLGVAEGSLKQMRRQTPPQLPELPNGGTDDATDT